MSYAAGTGYYSVEAPYAELLRSVGLADAMSAFDHPKIEVWRSIRERENCILDHAAGRLHIKRNKTGFTGVDEEVAGVRLLQKAGIKTVPLVGAGRLHDGRGFFISYDLAGYSDCEKLVAGGVPFEKLLLPTAQMAAAVHRAGLHHRDLYLCHFYAKLDPEPVDLVLMDAGRVKQLPRFLSRRWIVKDLAQLIYSTQSLNITDEQRSRWLAEYAKARGIVFDMHAAIESKVRSIAKHDESLKKRDPNRNVSIDR